jgi:hypothetical protein
MASSATHIGERRKDTRQLGNGGARPLELSRLERAEMIVQSVHDQPKRNVAFKLGCAPVEHKEPPRRCPLAGHVQQSGLTDPRLPSDLQEATLPVAQSVQTAIDRT